MERKPSDKRNYLSYKSLNGQPSFADELHNNGATLDDSGAVVDQFIEALWAMRDKTSGIPEVPDFIHDFCRKIELRVQTSTSACDAGRRLGKVAGDDADFMESIKRLSRLIYALAEFQQVESLMNETTIVLHSAAVFLEEELRAMLEDSPSEQSENFCKLLSFNGREAVSGRYSPELVPALHEIARTMIMVGYQAECSQAYFLSRRTAIWRNHLTKPEMEVLNMDDIAKMPWESLETEIYRWVNVVKTFSDVVFASEKKLAESVFAGSPEIHRRLFSNLLRVAVVHLLDFAEATAMAKLSVEKLFKYLDMYESIKNNLIPAIRDEPCSDEMIAEISTAAERIGKSVATIFSDLENSIKTDAGRTAVPGGAVHPLTRYVMNYLKYAGEYKDTLEEILGTHTNLSMPEAAAVNCPDPEKETESPHNFETMASTTPFAIQVVTIMDLLDGNLDRKSKLYKDKSLHYIFLMNNGRYILQKVKGSTEIRQVMGDTWCRRRSTVVRQFHKKYQRETWHRVLVCLNNEGIIVNGKVNKALLKERLKTFTNIFEEIHRRQSGWVVSDEQLQSELRISISAVLIPAYRSFVGRFKHHLDAARLPKYIKYQPEDVEVLIEGLFQGNTTSMSKRT